MAVRGVLFPWKAHEDSSNGEMDFAGNGRCLSKLEGGRCACVFVPVGIARCVRACLLSYNRLCLRIAGRAVLLLPMPHLYFIR